MAKKIVLSKKKIKEMEGFEEVLDLITDEKTILKEENAAFRDDTYELYTFLENEHERLQTLDKFFREKIKNHQNHPQLDTLEKEQKEHLTSLKLELIEILDSPDSPLSHNLDHLFKRLF